MHIQTKSLVIIIVAVIILVAAGGFGYFKWISKNVDVITPEQKAKITEQKKLEPVALPDPEKQLDAVKQKYPQVITGTIRFFDANGSYKTTIKAADGTEYTLQPAQPKSIYESYGVKNGGRVQVSAKVLAGNKIEWALMKPL